MKMRVLPLFFALTTLVPLVAQAQRTPSPGSIPKDLKVATTISGTITAKDPAQLAKEFGQVKCSQFGVVLQESSPSDVVVNVPGQPQKSKFPDSYAPVTGSVTGNHLGLGCKFALTVPASAVNKKGYLLLKTPRADLNPSPQGWQNPMLVPSMSDGGRNFVVNIITIK